MKIKWYYSMLEMLPLSIVHHMEISNTNVQKVYTPFSVVGLWSSLSGGPLSGGDIRCVIS